MTVERRLPHFLRGLLTSEKKELFEETKSYAKRAVTDRAKLLEGAPVDSYKGRRVIVKIPHSRQEYRITDISETDHIKEQVIKHGDALALSQALRIQPLKRKDILSWISFPIPFNPDTITVDSPNRYYWHSGTPFGNGGMEKLARNLEKAVPKK